MTTLTDIRDLSLEELKDYLKSIAAEAFRVRQIFQWIYQKGAWGFDAMTNVPKELRDRLNKDFILKPNTIAQKLTSEDGTTKFLFDLVDREKIESVLIPTQRRTTACISTQAGCKFGCKFCASGIGGWKEI